MKQLLTIMLVTLLLTGCNPPAPTPTPTPFDGIDNWSAVNFLTGETEDLWSNLGKPILIFFFSDSCSYCKSSATAVREIHNRYKDSKNLIVFSVGAGYSIQGITGFIHNYGLESTITVPDLDREFYHRFFSSGVPSFLFIGTDMKVKHKHTGGLTESTLDGLINTYL